MSEITLDDLEALAAKIRAHDELLGNLQRLETPVRGVAALAYNSASVTLSNITATAITFNSERFDDYGYHSTSVNTSRLAVPTGRAGKHLIIAQGRFAANSTGFRQLYIRLNGATVIASKTVSAVATSETDFQVPKIYDLAAGDYVEMVAYQNSGGNLDLLASSNWSPELMIVRL